MSDEFVLDAEPRHDMGKGASRRLRRAGKVPAIMYGAGKEPANLQLEHNKVAHSLEREAFYSHVLTVNVGGKPEKAILRDLQRHPSRPIIMHMDLLRVSADQKISMNVPLHFVGEEAAIGVKQEGGAVSHLMTEVGVSCLPKDLPEFIEVDITELKLNESLHLSNLKVPEGVELSELAYGEEHDHAVVSIHVVRVAAVEDDEAEGTEGEAGDDDAKPAEEGSDSDS